MKKRINYIDISKGILIILTVLAHVFQAGYVHCIIYAFHMPAFFVISGILINVTEPHKMTFFKFLRKKVYAYGIPLFFIECLGILTDLMRHGISLNIKGYIYNTVTLHFNDSNLWFLLDLFIIEIIFVALLHLLKEKRTIILISAVLFFISMFIPTDNYYVAIVVSCMRYFMFVSGGYIGKDIFEKKSYFLFWTSTIIVFLVAYIYGRRSTTAFSIENFAFVASSFAGTYVMIQIGFIQFGQRIKWFLTEAGKNTIIIYGTHHILYVCLGIIIGITDFQSTPLLHGIIICCIVCLLEVPVIYIINRWLPFLAGRYIKERG